MCADSRPCLSREALMPPPPPDRALRRLVAELAGLRDADADAVLSDLGETHRATVRHLLDGYRRAEPPAPHGRAMVSLEGLSPWLAARLGKAVAGDARLKASAAGREDPPGLAFDMTPFAMRALALSAVEAEGRPLVGPRRSTDHDWFLRLLTRFLGRGVAV